MRFLRQVQPARWALALAVLLVTACESRIPVGYQLPGTSTPAAPTAGPTATMVAVEPPEITLVVVSTSMDEADSGWSDLTIDLAVENRTDFWVMVEDAPGSTIRTAEGDVWDLTWSGTPGEIPPRFRSRIDQKRQALRLIGRMPAGSTVGELDLAYGAYPSGLDPVDEGYRGLRQIVGAGPVDGLSYPFLDAGGWEAYREQFSDQMALLDPGETLNVPFALLSVDEVRYLPSGGPTARYEFAMTAANGVGANQLLLELKGDVWTSTGFAAPVEARCRVNWGGFVDCPISSARQAEEAGEPSQVCLLLRDPAWALQGRGERGSLGQPLMVCFP